MSSVKSNSSANGQQSVISPENPDDLFDLIEEIAAGAFGAVYKGTYKPTGELVAVKVVGLQDEDSWNDLMMEIGIMKKCSHPNVVKFFGAYQQGEELWIAMELCQGSINTLYEVLETPLAEDEISWIVKETVKGLQYLHSTGIIHRDIKAPNILLTSNADIKLADFGVSALLQTPDQKRNTFVGTPWWMAPEIILAARDYNVAYDAKVDVWAIGIMCLELAQCRPPLSDFAPMEVLVEVPLRPAPQLSEPHKWSKAFVDFIDKCLQKEPNDRVTAAALLQHPFLANPKISKSATLKRMEIAEKAIAEFQSQAESESGGTTKSVKESSHKDGEDTDDETSDTPVRERKDSLSGIDEAEVASFATKKQVKRTYRCKTQRERTTQSERILQERAMQLQLRAMKRQQKEQLRLQEQEQAKRDEALQKLIKKHLKAKDKLIQQQQEQQGQFIKKTQKILEELSEKQNNELREFQKALKEDSKKTEKKLKQSQKDELAKLQKTKEKDKVKRKVEEARVQLHHNLDKLVLETKGAKDNLFKTHLLKTQQQEMYHGEILKQMKEKHASILEDLRQVQKQEVDNLQLENQTRKNHFQQHKQLVVSQLEGQLASELAQYQKDRAIYSKQQLRSIAEKIANFEKEDKKKEKQVLSKIKDKAQKKKTKEEFLEKRKEKKLKDELKEKQLLEQTEFQKEIQMRQVGVEIRKYQEDQVQQKKYQIEKEITSGVLHQQLEHVNAIHQLKKEQHKELLKLVLQHESICAKYLSDGIAEQERNQETFMKTATKMIEDSSLEIQNISGGTHLHQLSDELAVKKSELGVLAATELEGTKQEYEKLIKTIQEKSAALTSALKQEFVSALHGMLAEKKKVVAKIHGERKTEFQKLLDEQARFQDVYHHNQLKILEHKDVGANEMLSRHHKQQNEQLQWLVNNLIFIKHDPVLMVNMKETLAKDQAAEKKKLQEDLEMEKQFLVKQQENQKEETQTKSYREMKMIEDLNEKELQQLRDEEVSVLLEINENKE